MSEADVSLSPRSQEKTLIISGIVADSRSASGPEASARPENQRHQRPDSRRNGQAQK